VLFVCVWEREIERERESMCGWLSEREREKVCVCVCVWNRVCVCVDEEKFKRQQNESSALILVNGRNLVCLKQISGWEMLKGGWSTQNV